MVQICSQWGFQYGQSLVVELFSAMVPLTFEKSDFALCEKLPQYY